MINQDKFPLPKEVYDLMVEKFSLPLGYPYVFAKNKQTPIQVSRDPGPDYNIMSVSSKV